MSNPVKFAMTDRGPATTDDGLAGVRNILTDALHEMGYDDSLVDTLIEKDVIDFDTVNYTSDIMYYLIEHYGEGVLCGGLESAVAHEDLAAEVSRAGVEDWRSLKAERLERFVRYIIWDEVKAIGLQAAYPESLKLTRDKYFGRVMRNVLVDYGASGCYVPDVEYVIYHPDTCKVLAVILSRVTSNRTDQLIKLSQDEMTKHIKAYLIDPDAEDILPGSDSTEEARATIAAESLTEEESEKIKLLDRFIEDLKTALGNRESLVDKEGLTLAQRLQGLSLEDRIHDLSNADRQALRQLLD
jgi:hypothetical protein